MRIVRFIICQPIQQAGLKSFNNGKLRHEGILLNRCDHSNLKRFSGKKLRERFMELRHTEERPTGKAARRSEKISQADRSRRLADRGFGFGKIDNSTLQQGMFAFICGK